MQQVIVTSGLQCGSTFKMGAATAGFCQAPLKVVSPGKLQSWRAIRDSEIPLTSSQAPFTICAQKNEEGLEGGVPAGHSGYFRVAAATTAAVLAAAAFLQPVDVAQAYIGGGPYGREVTRGQDLSGRDFSGLDLTRQDFKTCILRQANFHGAKLLGASFFDTDLTGADFSDADLRGADFSLASAPKANFTNANFEGATVTGNTSFKGSIITGADFTDVNFREDQKKYMCSAASGVNPVTGNDTRETLFCR